MSSSAPTVKAEYLVGLDGEDRDVDFLVGLCAGQDVVQVVRHSNEGYMLRAPSVLTVDIPIQAARVGELLLASLNGIARTQDPQLRPVVKKGLYRIEPDGLTLRQIPQITKFDVRVPYLAPKPYPDLDELIVAALHDATISRVLKMLAFGDDRWFSWYWIYELVLEDLGEKRTERERKAVALAWATNDELRRFRVTANWHETEHGRHAIPQKPNQKPPSDLMHELEAQQLIAKLVLVWLRRRVAIPSSAD